MPASSPIALILGADPGVGAHCTSYIVTTGYNVALAARSVQDGMVEKGRLQLRVDLAWPETAPELFAKVKRELGIPSIVVYNGATRTLLSPSNPLSLVSFGKYKQDIAVNLDSVLLAAQEAIACFRELPASAAKTFIYSGNKLNVMSDPKTLPFGIAKTAAAH